MLKPTELTRLEINLAYIKENYAEIKRYVSPAEVSVVVKGNAYGHGAKEVVKTLIEAGCLNFWAANLVEGIELRRAIDGGGKVKLNILGGLTREQLKEAVNYDLIPFIYHTEQLAALSHTAQKAGLTAEFNLKLDTGLGRLGLLATNLNDFCWHLDKLDGVRLGGVGTHLACSTVTDPLNELQYRRFRDGVVELKARYGQGIKAHMSGSAAAMLYPEMNFDMVRTGSIVFGLSHFTENPLPLKPALSYKTVVVQVKEVPVGWKLGYGRNPAEKPTLLALLPIGLVDGLISVHGRNQSANVLIGGIKYPIISIAGDQSIVDVSAVGKTVQVGDEAVLIGSQGSEVITAREVGLQAKTNYAEVLMKISPRIPRIYYNNGDLIKRESLVD